MFETLYGGGLRVGELVGLDLADLDLPQGLVRARGKGKRERLCPVGPEAVAWLGRWLGARRPAAEGEAAVFLNRDGGRLSPERRADSWNPTSPGWTSTSTPAPTPSATASRPISWTAGPTSAASRSCWATAA